MKTRKSKKKIQKIPMSERNFNKIGYGKSSISKFYQCICHHIDFWHDKITGECTACKTNCFIKCKQFIRIDYVLVVDFGNNFDPNEKDNTQYAFTKESRFNPKAIRYALNPAKKESLEEESS